MYVYFWMKYSWWYSNNTEVCLAQFHSILRTFDKAEMITRKPYIIEKG